MTRSNHPLASLNRRAFLHTATAALASAVGSTAIAAPNRGRRKKGFCCTTKEGSRWLDQIQALRANWFYSWGANMPDGVPEGVEFAPMIWGKPGKKSDAMFARLKQQGEAGEISTLMGFNEPDQHDQSHLTVEEALAAWPRLMDVGLPLASPGCVHPDRQWMIDFMQGVDERKLRVDYVCVHSYGGPSANALLTRLEKVYKMYRRPIWITEFAVGDWNAKTVTENKHSPQQVAKFMRDVLPMLDEAKFVDRFAWFSANQDSRALGTSALFDGEGKLTELGEVYRSF